MRSPRARRAAGRPRHLGRRSGGSASRSTAHRCATRPQSRRGFKPFPASADDTCGPFQSLGRDLVTIDMGVAGNSRSRILHRRNAVEAVIAVIQVGEILGRDAASTTIARRSPAQTAQGVTELQSPDHILVHANSAHVFTLYNNTAYTHTGTCTCRLYVLHHITQSKRQT